MPTAASAALRIPGGAALSRKQIDEYAAHAAKYGAKGLAYAKIDEAGAVNSPVAKFFAEGRFEAVLQHVGAGNGDIVFFGAGAYNKVSDFMGAVRLKAGKDFNLISEGWAPLWVTDFPMFEWDEEEGASWPCTTPSPRRRWIPSTTCAPMRSTAVSRGYDMVLNGNEIGGGSIRIHRPDLQSAVFELLGIGAEEARGQVRLPAGRAEVRRAAARRHRLRHRPHRRADGRHRVDPRRDRRSPRPPARSA